MSTPVDTSLTSLKASTAQIMAIISGTQQIPQGSSHFALITQAGSCSQGVWGWTPALHHAFMLKELMCVWSMTPQAWPNWHSIGYDNPCLLKHIWHAKLLTWEVLGDHTFDLPVAAAPSTGSTKDRTLSSQCLPQEQSSRLSQDLGFKWDTD
ncbi:uncharacterized protein BJ212DRAFT_1297307 [Suillus subaureus]|uniref:Uncharacterized protein n=1 Tax=Suillus subaureus TaxID=48587 RepID=A0A9P7EIT1_9AGAM|nr:uncharacterized protein BJ212DRAFT_1297307 [Suillus subaureus]KAG1822067.1 hypothetical protein BJ212DRAFT_1297307 [Suillus subaureus]